MSMMEFDRAAASGTADSQFSSQPLGVADQQQQQPGGLTPASSSIGAGSSSMSLPTSSLAAVEHINRSATAALRSPVLTPEQASTLERALNDARIILGRDAEGTQPWIAAEAAVLNNLGCLLRRINRLAESVQFLQHAVFLEQKAHGKPTVPTLLNLSAACNALGDTQRACDASLACMADYANLPSSLRAITLHNLAMCDYHVAQPQVRERVTLLLERAYSESVQAFGMDHVTTETIYRHLAAITGETSSRNAELAAKAMKPLALSASAPSLVRNIDDGAASLSALQQLQQGVMTGARFSTDAEQGAGVNEKEARMLQKRLQEEAEAARAEAAALEERRAREDLERAKAAAAEAEARRIQKQKELEAQKEAQRRYELRTQYKSGMNEEMGRMNFLRFSQATAETSKEAAPTPLSFTHVREQFRVMTERENLSRRAATFVGTSPVRDESGAAGSGDPLSMTSASGASVGRVSMSTLRRQQQGNIHHHHHHHHSGNNNNNNNSNESTQEAARQTHSIFRETSHKRRERSDKERAEDVRYEAATALRRAEMRAERLREERLAALRLRVENRAASLIQRTWRKHATNMLQHQAMTSKAMRQSEDMRRARRVVRFAQKWLQRSAGRILLCRLKYKYEAHFVFNAVRKAQCAFRCYLARKRCNEKRAERQHFLGKLLEYERREGAIMRVQMWYRVQKCKNSFERARADIKAIAARKIQRFARKILSRERAAAADALRRRRENAAALKIERVWRGYQGRIAAVMVRLQQKMNRLKIKDRRAAERVQRVGRAFIARKKFARLAFGERRRRAIADAYESAGSTVVLREAQAAQDERALAAQQLEESKKRVPLKPRPPTPSRERVKAAEAFRDESRRMYLDSLQQREDEQRVKEFSRPVGSEYDKLWAVEQLSRLRDFNARRRNTCATLLQRWWRLYRRPVLDNHRSHYEAKSAARKIAYFDDKFRRERLRAMNDLAKPIRELRQEMERELKAEAAAALTEAAANSDGNVTGTIGAAQLFQEWYEKPRGDTERYIISRDLMKAKREAVLEKRQLDEMMAQARKLISRYQQ